MNKISAVVIAKNEENMIADCIESLSFCEEILVIDNNSEDKTSEIARHLGAKVYNVKEGNFSDMRNFGLTKAKNYWIFYVDADERVSSSLRDSIENIITNTKIQTSAFRIKRKNFYLGKHEWPNIERLERLFKKRQLKEWYGEIHETARVDGEVGEITDGFLLHYTHRDLSSMLKKTIEWSGVEANLRFKAHHPKVTWWRFFRVMLTAFYNSYIMQKGYKAGAVGVIESIYQSFSMFITYARLWELQNSSMR